MCLPVFRSRDLNFSHSSRISHRTGLPHAISHAGFGPCTDRAIDSASLQSSCSFLKLWDQPLHSTLTGEFIVFDRNG